LLISFSNTELVNPIKNYLIKRKETLAVAESVTSGLLQFTLSSADNASGFYQGGITTYNLGQKCRHLLVDPIYSSSCNCVSPRVAEEMALNVSHLFSSQWGIGITGYATPVAESENKLFAYYAVACNGVIVIKEQVTSEKNLPSRVQSLYIIHVLRKLGMFIKTRK
jgi:nicotinamide-nucleotide amidase